MIRSKQKTTFGALCLIVGAIAVVVSTSLDVALAPFAFAAGMVGLMAGLIEIELAAIWQKLGE